MSMLCPAHRVLSYLDKWGNRNKALKAFEWMEMHSNPDDDFDTHDTFLYTRLMTMFTRRSKDCSEALRIFDNMQKKGIKPDLIAYNTAINAAGTFSGQHCLSSAALAIQWVLRHVVMVTMQF